MHANTCFLESYDLSSVADVAGKTDHDLSPAYLADQFVKDDALVLKGHRVINRIELNSLQDESVGWFITTKMPLRNCAGKMAGTTGFTRNVSATQATLGPYQDMADVVQYIRSHIQKTISIGELARQSNLSVSAFERRFKKYFQLTPIQYIRKLRVHLACQALIHRSDAISRIAIDCGFCDHSYMTKAFKQFMGVTPQQFRKRYAAHVIPDEATRTLTQRGADKAPQNTHAATNAL